MDKTFDEYLSEGKNYFIAKDYQNAQNSFVEASKLDENFISKKFRKFRKIGQYNRNDYKQECLNNGIYSLLIDIETSLAKYYSEQTTLTDYNLTDIFNPFHRNFSLDSTQSIAILKDYIILIKESLRLSSEPKYWAYEYKLLGEIFIILNESELAYRYFKKSLYFNKTLGIKPKFKKLAKQYGKDDKLEDGDFNYKLLKNISFNEITANVTNKESKGKSRFEINGKSVSVESLCKHYYKEQNFEVLHSENHFWWFTADIFFKDLTLHRLHSKLDKKEYVFELNQRISEFNKFNMLDLTKEYYNQNKPDEEDYTILDFQHWFDILNSMSMNKALKLSKEIHSHDPIILPTSGLPDLIVWNDETFFFVEVKSTNDILSDRQKWWHLYISEELNIPIVIFMVNKNGKQVDAIKRQYLIK